MPSAQSKSLTALGISLPNYPEPTDLTQRSLRFTFVDKDNTPEVIWAFCKKESYNYGLQGKSIPRLSTTAYGGLAPTLRQIERFYTKNGLPIDEDPAYDYPNRYEVANFPVEEKDINGEGESLKLNMGREPRFYAWIAFHNGYYEVSGEDDREEFSYAPKWKRGKDKKYKQLVQFMKRQNMGLTNDNKYGTKTGYLNKKGTHPGTSASKSTGFKVIDYPWPMVRLAELYLNYAEACVECNDLTEAKKYLNYVRERAGIPKVEVSWDGIAELTQDKLREIVHQERLIELYLENHNFWDIRRWGIAETLGEQPKGLSVQATTITEFAKPVSVDVQRRFIPAHYLMPLPISEINKNPNMVQNPGYDE